MLLFNMQTLDSLYSTDIIGCPSGYWYAAYYLYNTPFSHFFLKSNCFRLQLYVDLFIVQINNQVFQELMKL